MRLNQSNSSCKTTTKIVFGKLRALWGTKEYDDDFLEILMCREKNRMKFNFLSPQISERKRLVDWIKSIAAKKELDNFSIHLAIYLLDIFMDSYKIVGEKLEPIALVCLLIATKFEERDCNALKMSELNDLTDNKYSVDEFHGIEILILRHVQWNLLLPTVVHFVHINIEFLIGEDDLINEDISETEKWAKAQLIIQNYLDYVMEDVHLMHEKPSMVGAAIMAQTRTVLRFVKIWPRKLNSITGYKYIELKQIILRLKQMNKKSNNNN